MTKANKQNNQSENKYHFLIRNVGKGLLILALFVVAFILFKKFAGNDYKIWFSELNPLLVFTIYSFSEIFFGIITPEIFMAWGIEQGGVKTYIKILIGLMLISYAAGYLNYWAGRFFRKLPIVRWFVMKRMYKYTKYLNQFGGFLLIVASTTPLPFAAICLLVGTASFSHKKFLLFTLFRLARFSIYGYIVWQAGSVA
ncbi:MAG: VTT domain-containing protein [Bacteroidia bacterium]